MTHDTQDSQARRADHDLELEPLAPPVDRSHHDQYAHYTHELTEDSTETSARVLVRIVPLAYGALLGTLSDRLVLGLGAGILLSLAFDLFMGRGSLARSLSRAAVRRLCPAVAGGARLIGRTMRHLRLPPARRLIDARCSQPEQ
jgi:hypothetical protein